MPRKHYENRVNDEDEGPVDPDVLGASFTTVRALSSSLRSLASLGRGGLVAAALVAMTGCGSVRVVQEAKTGGTLALEGAHEAARSKAEDHMRTQCPRGWQIVEEGEALNTDGTTREWRITYACVGATTAVRVVAF